MDDAILNNTPAISVQWEFVNEDLHANEPRIPLETILSQTGFGPGSLIQQASSKSTQLRLVG